MNVRLELEFQSIAELKEYLDKTINSVFPAVQKTEMNVPEPGIPAVQTAPEPVTPVPAAAPPQAPDPEPEQLAFDTAPQTPAEGEAPAQAVSVAAASYTLDDIARAGSELVDIGRQPELPALLQQFGITSLPELPPDKYGEFATKLREMGARI